jgi:integrase
MSVLKRGKSYYLRIRPFGELINVRTSAGSKSEARNIEMGVLTACRSSDYRSLNAAAREVCVRLFRNQGWEFPCDLAPRVPVREETTVWKAVNIFQNYPEIKGCKARPRYEYALVHLVEKLGKDKPIKSIWVPDLKTYQIERLNEGAAPATINRELSTLSKIFSVLIELQLVETNPVRLVKRLSEKSGERQVYLSLHDIHLIADKCPEWYQLVIWTAYYTGMRRGEIFGLTRKQINLGERIITLAPPDTKEAHWKRVPIHRELVPYLKAALRLPSLNSEKVFLVRDGRELRELGVDTFKNPWPRACTALEDASLLKKPFPHFHDLRHTWKTNARRSGMDPEIRETILGHWSKQRSVTERYGRVGEQELLHAIDRMTFDHGNTEICVSTDSRSTTRRDQNVIKSVPKKKKATG